MWPNGESVLGLLPCKSSESGNSSEERENRRRLRNRCPEYSLTTGCFHNPAVVIDGTGAIWSAQILDNSVPPQKDRPCNSELLLCCCNGFVFYCNDFVLNSAAIMMALRILTGFAMPFQAMSKALP